jgi:hypothetical protein
LESLDELSLGGVAAMHAARQRKPTGWADPFVERPYVTWVVKGSDRLSGEGREPRGMV